MNCILVASFLGILAICLLACGLWYLAVEIRHKRKMRQLRRKWEENNRWTKKADRD